MLVLLLLRPPLCQALPPLLAPLPRLNCGGGVPPALLQQQLAALSSRAAQQRGLREQPLFGRSASWPKAAPKARFNVACSAPKMFLFELLYTCCAPVLKFGFIMLFGC